mmetsp:Transcript_33768/g.99484  ORF Transcript_33768/g.99484 Transcript_33768/m.99484 type:complete len:410 (-) Transcript_33768:32-1261(-)
MAQPRPRRPLVIVGCGQIVTHHCSALAALPPTTFRVVALVDPSPERRQVISTQLREDSSSHLLECTEDDKPLLEYASLDDVLRNQDIMSQKPAVFISVPHDLHVTLAKQALDTGLDVIMEKPLAPTIDGCHELLRHADQSRGMLIISEQSPYWQEVAKAKTLLQEGAIGTLISAAAYYYESMRDNVTSGTDAAGGLGWRTSLKRAGGGIVIDGGLHWLRPLREFCGEVESVVGVCRNAEAGLGMEGETVAHALLKMSGSTSSSDESSSSYRTQPANSGQLVATFSANMMHTAPMAHDECPYFRLTGTKGELIIYGNGLNPNGGGGLKLYNEENVGGIDLFPRDRQGGFFLGFRGVWEIVAGILAEEDRSTARETVRSAAADVGVALTLYKSSESGKWEDCEQFLQVLKD